ncbi:hypothetical protein ES703_06289 [subsurface metagenome]
MIKKKTLEERIVLSDRAEVTLPVDKIEERQKKNEYATAILYASTTVEKILYNKIKVYLKDEKLEKILRLKGRGLGTYSNWCLMLKLVDQNKLRKIRSLKKYRDRIVHEKGFLMKTDIIRVGNQLPLKKKLDKALKSAIEFINSTPISE